MRPPPPIGPPNEIIKDSNLVIPLVPLVCLVVLVLWLWR